jgi:hypothetical protein
MSKMRALFLLAGSVILFWAASAQSATTIFCSFMGGQIQPMKHSGPLPGTSTTTGWERNQPR